MVAACSGLLTSCETYDPKVKQMRDAQTGSGADNADRAGSAQGLIRPAQMREIFVARLRHGMPHGLKIVN